MYFNGPDGHKITTKHVFLITVTKIIDKRAWLYCFLHPKKVPIYAITFTVEVEESRQPWAGVCLGPTVCFQKVWKEKSWIFLHVVEKMISIISIQV